MIVWSVASASRLCSMGGFEPEPEPGSGAAERGYPAVAAAAGAVAPPSYETLFARSGRCACGRMKRSMNRTWCCRPCRNGEAGGFGGRFHSRGCQSYHGSSTWHVNIQRAEHQWRQDLTNQGGEHQRRQEVADELRGRLYAVLGRVPSSGFLREAGVGQR